ncbi:MAG: GntR family transcriptional regulator [Rhodospirillales bacterium]|jgi:GntR family transcriptional regulator, histidine utilization repressor|nr:GntR family transcriptional regulator [Rhodospirillales bacterium]MBT4039063.1 GntR family transcriptional regulator [Rhodospirillales bacterium]MBT4627584.1 GntR family transcriptional regulator [Rhodospirillales bacterium]MBT5351788.1 GntR family transcriptional regulator [Rhodospirillales bacterium]MBT6110255.1 GntR family transcriptional regulator [Rhodospirillales bacterium]
MSSDLDGEGPLFKQFQREIVQKIVSGELVPGDRLESETELVKIYGLSRQTIGKALTGLAEQGLLERNKRAGTVVSLGSRERFSMPALDISLEVVERGGMYEYEIIDVSIHTALSEETGLCRESGFRNLVS